MYTGSNSMELLLLLPQGGGSAICVDNENITISVPASVSIGVQLLDHQLVFRP